MSLKNTEMLEKNKYEIKFDVDNDTFQAAVNRAYKKNCGRINVPGFRRGKAPRAIIEKMYGKGFFYEDALDEVCPAAYSEAVKASALEIVGRPEIDVESIDESGVVFKAIVYTKPEATIENYRGIAVSHISTEATDEDVAADLDRVRERNSRTIEVTDRPAENGDIANIDYEGFADGVAFDGGKDTGHNLTLGSGAFIPGFEDQIIGHNAGDEFDVNVTFPEEYHAKELAGKAAVFKTKLNTISKKELPELDDEFARDNDFDTLDEYKADIKAKIVERKKHADEHGVEDQVLDALAELVVADIPEVMFEAETENCVRDYDNRLRMQGLDLSTYFKYTGMDLDALKTQMRPQAEKQVKVKLALEAVANAENIEVTAEDIESEYKKVADAYGMEVEKVKEAIDEAAISADVRTQKALDLVKANTVDKPAEEAKTEE